jgi:PEP-CTERM motif
MKSRLGLAVAAVLCLIGAVPSKATIYLYEINAFSYDDPSSSITGSFTMDSSIGPASISNVDIHATLQRASGPFNFTFDQVVNPTLTWPIGYLWFANDAFSAGDTYFRMGFHHDTSLNDGSYLIGMWGNPANPHQSEISILGVGDWQDIYGKMTPSIAGAVPEPSTWAMMILGFLGLGFMAFRKSALHLACLNRIETIFGWSFCWWGKLRLIDIKRRKHCSKVGCIDVAAGSIIGASNEL